MAMQIQVSETQQIPEEWQLQPVNFLRQSSEQTQNVSQRIFEAAQGQSP
jgi:hypothetical protein